MSVLRDIYMCMLRLLECNSTYFSFIKQPPSPFLQKVECSHLHIVSNSFICVVQQSFTHLHQTVKMLHNISLKASFVYIMNAILTTLSTVTEPTFEKPSPFIAILDPPLNNKVR